MKSVKAKLSPFCILLALLFFCSVFFGCADTAGTSDRDPKAAAGEAGATLPGNGSEDEKTDPAIEPGRTEPEGPYDTYEAFMNFIKGLTDQDKIDLVQRTADSITVVQDPFESKWPDVEENPDALAKVEALGEEMIPYLIGYTFKIIDTDPENQKKAMLMLLCSIAKYGTGREVDRTILPEYPEEFRKYWIEGNCRSWSVRFYLWYTGKQAG